MKHPELVATYRLQLNAEFTLHDAARRIPYLHALGVSHLYLSPVFTARAGSTHGYDVADPTRVSEALGGEEALRGLARDAHARGMGVLLDIVPNHMGIGEENPFWDDVLEHGQASRYADWFDVAWRAPAKRLANRVLVPVLGDTLPHVIERGELSLARTPRGVRVKYFDKSFPLAPETVPPGDPASVTGEALRKLLARQHYELAFWRSASRELNYRRFFDVNELISLRVERQDVFTATHARVVELVSDGVIDALRVDHIDGLLEPRQYLERLREAVGHDVPIFVEKILAHGETIPADWPVDGTTGYEFLVSLEDLFISPAGAAALESRYRGAKERRGFNRVSVAAKRRVLRSSLNADVRRIAPMLARVAQLMSWPERTIGEYAGAIVEFVSALPVYRMYIDSANGTPSDTDRTIISAALDDVRTRTTVCSDALAALESTLVDDWAADGPGARARMSFVLRLQQLSGPAAAKGVEDTALYVYAPLTSRSEVGNDPSVSVEGAVERFAIRQRERAERFPEALNATNTHDTKRSADSRARIDALSENAAEWRRALTRWRRRNRPLRTVVRGRPSPSSPQDDFIYQSLIAIWPLTQAMPADAPWREELRERLTAYVIKASREAKVHTNWTDPDSEYEGAITSFVAGLLDPARSHGFDSEVAGMVAALAPQALWNSLSTCALHIMSPGVPDIYQGDELWYAALVDPDNRRPVDWQLRQALLDEVARDDRSLAQLRDEMKASELKMRITSRLLGLRSQLSGLRDATFAVLRATGSRCNNVYAFERHLPNGTHLVVLAARLSGGIPWPQAGSVWSDTSLSVGRPRRYRRVLHGGEVEATGGALRLADIFAEIPVEVLVADPVGDLVS